MSREELVAQRFALEQLAGSGGMGDVYAAVDRTTGERVALKRMRWHGNHNFERFNREAALLAELRHPAIVRYVAHGTTALGDAYLAMEWLSGMDLGAVLASGALSVKATLALGARIAEALGVAHARGVLHRDIKPSNVFLREGRADQAVLLDFGLARIVDASEVLTRVGAVIGTPGYMAPEQARGEVALDPRADVFSLGCVLFHCIAGRPPFDAERADAILMKIVHEEAPRLRDLRPSVPAELDALLARMLAKSRSERPLDGAHVTVELRNIRVPETNEASHVGPPPRALTRDEQRVVCFLAAAARSTGDASGTSLSLSAPRHDLARELREIAEKHGGRVDLLVGGTVMVSFSGAGTVTDLASKSARCALAMRGILRNAPMGLAMGRGDVSSPIPVGVAIERVAQLLAFGGAESSDIRLDETVAGLLDPRFEVRRDAQGFVLAGFRDLLDASEIVHAGAAPFVGREREIGTLRSIFDECVAEPVARVALVTGPPGAGKSRVRAELLRELAAREPKPAIWSSYADSVDVGSPFGGVSQLVRSAAGISDGDDVEARRRKVNARVSRHAGSLDATRVAEFLRELIGVPALEPISVELRAAREDAALMGEQYSQAWCDIVDAECRTNPLVLVLEDLHWGDLPSVKLVDAALRRLSERPLFVLAFARPGVHALFPKMWMERGLQEIRLGPLSRKAQERLVTAALPDVDGGRLAAIVERAAGNPFFLEEIVRAAKGGTIDALPDTVVAMVEARLESLDPEARRVLRAASILRRFTAEDVHALLGATSKAADTANWLAHLTEIDLLERRSEHDDATLHGFRSAVVREAAYATLTESDRRLGHRLAAERLEAQGHRDPVAVAEHFERAGELARAIGGYVRAAEDALTGGDLASAMQLAERGVRCGADGPALGALRLVELEVCVWRADPASAEAYEADLSSTLARGSKGFCRAMGFLAVRASQVGELERLLSIAESLPGVDPAFGAESAYVSALSFSAVVLYRFAEHEVAARLVARIDRVARELGIDDPYVEGWACLASAYRAFAFGDPWSHQRLAALAAANFARAGDLRMAGQSETEAGMASVALGAFELALSSLSGIIARADARGLVVTKMMASRVLALALARIGKPADAREAARASVDAGRAGTNRLHEAAGHAALARACLAEGAFDLAEQEAKTAMKLTPAATIHAEAEATLAEAYLASARPTEALEAAERAMDLLESRRAIGHVEALVRLVHARALHATGDEAAAREAIEHARARLETRAASIPDESARKNFLTRVLENAQSIELARAWGRPR